MAAHVDAESKTESLPPTNITRAGDRRCGGGPGARARAGRAASPSRAGSGTVGRLLVRATPPGDSGPGCRPI